jgi:hypothetical protein
VGYHLAHVHVIGCHFRGVGVRLVGPHLAGIHSAHSCWAVLHFIGCRAGDNLEKIFMLVRN